MIGVIDIGGTTIKTGVYAPDGSPRLQKFASVRTPLHDASAVASPVDRFAEALQSALDVVLSPSVTALGISTRTPFGLEDGKRILLSKSFDIFRSADAPCTFSIEAFFATTGLPVTIINDAVANLQAELTFGVAVDETRAALLIVGTGIGYVASVDGVATVDELGNAPEVSTTWIDELGCNLSQATNGVALQKRFGRLPEDGDIEMAEFAVHYQARVLAPVIERTSADVLVLTGGVCDHMGATYRDVLHRELGALLGRSIDIRRSTFGSDVGLLGAGIAASST
jgi:predicted NBD/HSP70 family sugar kinase